MLFIEHKKKPKRKRLTFLHFAEKEGLFHDPKKGELQIKCYYATQYCHFTLSDWLLK